MKRVPIIIKQQPIILDKQFECKSQNPFGYIYIVENLINHHLYVGKHEFSHPYMDLSYEGSGKILHQSYQKYGKSNFQMRILQWIYTNSEDLNTAEIYWIDMFNTYRNPHHYNLCPGGEGAISGECNPAYQESVRQRNREAHLGKHIGKENPKARKIIQFTLLGEFVCSYDSISDAVRCNGNLSADAISLCCSRQNKSSGGYLWAYYEDWKESKDKLIKCLVDNYNSKWDNMIGKSNPMTGKFGRLSPTSKPLVQLDIFGKFVQEFESASMTPSEFNPDKIRCCCRGVNKSHKGYRWMYLSEYQKKQKSYWVHYWTSSIENENKHRQNKQSLKTKQLTTQKER